MERDKGVKIGFVATILFLLFFGSRVHKSTNDITNRFLSNKQESKIYFDVHSLLESTCGVHPVEPLEPFDPRVLIKPWHKTANIFKCYAENDLFSRDKLINYEKYFIYSDGKYDLDVIKEIDGLLDSFGKSKKLFYANLFNKINTKYYLEGLELCPEICNDIKYEEDINAILLSLKKTYLNCCEKEILRKFEEQILLIKGYEKFKYIYEPNEISKPKSLTDFIVESKFFFHSIISIEFKKTLIHSKLIALSLEEENFDSFSLENIIDNSDFYLKNHLDTLTLYSILFKERSYKERYEKYELHHKLNKIVAYKPNYKTINIYVDSLISLGSKVQKSNFQSEKNKITLRLIELINNNEYLDNNFSSFYKIISFIPESKLKNELKADYIKLRLENLEKQDTILTKYLTDLSIESGNLYLQKDSTNKIRINYQRLAKSEDILKKENERINTLLQKGLFFSICTIFGLVIFFTRRENIKLQEINKELNQKNLKLEEQKNDLAGLKRELSHRVKNSLLAIGARINSQIRKLKKGVNVNPAILLTETRSRVLAIELLHTQLQDVDSTNKVKLQKYLVDLSKHLQQSGDYSKNEFTLDIKLNDAPLAEVGIASRLGLAITELALNAIKYARVPMKKLMITAAMQEDLVVIRIADNGPGMPTDYAVGSGLSIVKTIIEKQLKGSMLLEKTTIGTSWVLKIPQSSL